MKASISPSSGYCIVDGKDPISNVVLSTERTTLIEPRYERHTLTLAHDWQVFEVENEKSALELTRELTTILKCISLIRLRLLTTDSNYGGWIYSEIESTMGTYVTSDTILNKLLIAPLSKPENLKFCAGEALSSGYGAIGSILNRLYDFQPLISRFSNIWLKLPDILFVGTGNSKQYQWLSLSKSGNLLKILEAANKQDIKKIFGQLAFLYQMPKERESFAKLGRIIADSIFEGVAYNPVLKETFEDDSQRSTANLHGKGPKDPGSELKRALSEIDAISKAVSKGEDTRAEKYLNDLIERQTISGSDTKHAVKSLCNIARQCADMFRADFESLCLKKAYEIDPTDSWTMIQYGDHLKRMGKYDEAEQVVETAMGYGEEEIGERLIADILSQRGEYSRAIEKYKSIQDWSVDHVAMTGIADNLRHLGRFQEAFKEYKILDELGFGSDRVSAGIAEIAKREGRLDEAVSLYESIITTVSNDQSWWVYSVAYAGLLKQIGEYQSAITIIEDVIAKVPFSMHARVLRASLWGLSDEEITGLEGLPQSGSSYKYNAYGEWISEYTRGLLLLRTTRYKDAQESLLQNLENSVLGMEQESILRLATALSLIAERKVHLAKQYIPDVTTIYNPYIEYVANVLRYHVSILETDSEKTEELYKYLVINKSNNLFLWDAIESLRSGNSDKAIRIEVDAMLRLAA